MKAIYLVLTMAAFLFSGGGRPNQARGWNGLIPLHSTRADVTRRLGAGQGSCECVFTTPQETVFVEYAESPCKGPIYGWNVPSGTVLRIRVTPRTPRPFRVNDLTQDFVETREDLVTTYYTNLKQGIQHAVQNGSIVFTQYIPSTESEALRCEGFPIYDGGVTNYRPYDAFGQIPESGLFARLDNFAIELANNPEWKGYVVSYAGSVSRAGEAKAASSKVREYLVNRRRIAPERVVAIDGGFRERSEYELYLIRAGLPPPSPKPTLSLSQVTVIKDK